LLTSDICDIYAIQNIEIVSDAINDKNGISIEAIKLNTFSSKCGQAFKLMAKESHFLFKQLFVYKYLNGLAATQQHKLATLAIDKAQIIFITTTTTTTHY